MPICQVPVCEAGESTKHLDVGIIMLTHQQDVLWLKVTVHDALVVEVRDCLPHHPSLGTAIQPNLPLELRRRQGRQGDILEVVLDFLPPAILGAIPQKIGGMSP